MAGEKDVSIFLITESMTSISCSPSIGIASRSTFSGCINESISTVFKCILSLLSI